MKTGLFYVCESPDNDVKRAYAEMLDQVEYAEELGFESVWLAEHHGSNYGSMPRPAIMAAAIAQRTARIRIGAMVSILPFENPVRTAEDWAMVDVLSEGRLDFGTGRGYQPREFAMMGKDPAQSRELYNEALDIVLGLWREDSFSYDGPFHQLENTTLVPRPLQSQVPTWVAALSPETYEMAAARGVRIITQPNNRQTLEDLKKNYLAAEQVYFESGFERQDLEFPMNMVVHLASSKSKALERSERSFDWYMTKLRGLVPGSDGKPAAKGYETYAAGYAADEAKFSLRGQAEERLVLVTDPDDAREFMLALQQELDLKHFTCFMRFGGLGHDDVKESMRLWATEVAPALREAAGGGAA
ncbi:LLM class flavin-dependent oxidoreductase [Nocardioides daeguensis]|uniref:LLM class flavin-dependent oxidoreductase n=1 Tax=Nocardioides daeguensis TaxID=908359 RepID=A0ABP6W697_9ACTN|nr:LLM class flavin-dependent oxidoreductase [Nocardioides daeguensis]MBV6729812.1 LLM class flavin-dependent oxidoreductase [Nocardioides daeguensis]MCR1775383.1 LLM class flavin-dependent oxidoreductase [Nocardioides daeguensis]